MKRYVKYAVEEIFPPLNNPFDVVEYDQNGMYVNSWRFSSQSAAEKFKSDMEEADEN